MQRQPRAVLGSEETELSHWIDAAGRVERWRRYLDGFAPAKDRPHDDWALHALRRAVDAVAVGTYGVGALLVDESGQVIVSRHNEVHLDGFRSDLHAEMVVLNEYESRGWARDEARRLTLVTSLEPCPMCTTRLIVAGIGTVLHLSPDSVGGMAERRRHLPPVFRRIAEEQGQVWGRAECSDELRHVAHEIWDVSRALLEQRRREPSEVVPEAKR